MHVAIIGAYGSAGAAAAYRLAESVGSEITELTLIDGGEPGGLCILDGCMPSKAVLSSAMHAHEANEDPRVTANAEVNLPETIQHKNKYIQNFANHRESGIKEIAQQENTNLVEQNVQFESDGSLKLEDGTRIQPDYTVLATGSKVNVPSIQGIDDVEFLTSDDILDMKDVPESVVVMGFGAIGMEMSAYLSSIGVNVTVIEHDDRPIDGGSDKFGDELMDIYRKEFGIQILTNTYEESLEETSTGVRVNLSGNTSLDSVEAEELCLFTGRVPNLEGLGLDEMGVDFEGEWVDSTLQLNADSTVFVAGDATGDRMILHVAKEQGILSADNILRDIRGEELHDFYSPEHIVYFTGVGKYPYVRYGVTADEARFSEDLITVTRHASDDGIFKLKEASKGVASLVVNKETGTIKGYEGLHLHSDVMLKTMQVLIDSEADVVQVPDRAYHPTTPELLDGLFREASERVQKMS